MSDEQGTKRERKPKAPLTEVGIIGVMEQGWLLLPDDEARKRAALYWCARAGYDIRPLLLNGNGDPARATVDAGRTTLPF